MIAIRSQKLAPLYAFFETYGMERLHGLSESYFFDLDDDEKEEAWKFLEDRFYLSVDCITGLYMLDPIKAVDLFKKTIDFPVAVSEIPAERRAMENNRLLILSYINGVDPDEKYVAAMCELAKSEFSEVRGRFARSVPIYQVTHAAVEALKGMIFTETERIPLSSAITKLMVIHGLDYDRKDPVYKAIYLSLRSDNHQEKISGIKRLELHQLPDYA